MSKQYKTNSQYEILTSSGWREFNGVHKSKSDHIVKIILENRSKIECTKNHIFYIYKKEIQAQNLIIGDCIESENGSLKIVDIEEYYELCDVYDLVGVSETSSYIVNGVNTHNCDEYAFVPPNIAGEFWDSILPTISSSPEGSKFIITSTPNGDTGKFAELWRGAKAGINEFKDSISYVPWDIVPGRDEAFKKKFVGLLGEKKFRQEYGLEFLTEELTLVDSALITAAELIINQKIEADELIKFTVNSDKFQFFKKLIKDATYIVGVDPSTGNGNDNGVIQVFEFPAMEQVLEFSINTLSPQVFYTELKTLLNFLSKATEEIYFSVENNGVGQGILAAYEGDQEPPSALLISDKDKVGFNSNVKTKLRACLQFKEAFERGRMALNSPQLLKELKSFIRHQGSYAAQTGGTDDRIMGCIVVFYIIQQIATNNTHAYDMIYSVAAEIEERHGWTVEKESVSDNNGQPAQEQFSRSVMLQAFFDNLHGENNQTGFMVG